MNNEQIKEVMRLSDDIRTAHTSEWDVPDLVEAQNDLEAYLRTIGEPENTFPLNPNGSSKWAHLQKHDGAQAIGVVFRTGSGSVGSLVDGRVVWADWLAHPNGSKPESVNAELLEALKSAKNGLEWYQDAHQESASECDSEAMQKIDAAIALARGFTERQQADGSMDLNGYVYAFAEAMYAEGRKIEREEDQHEEAGHEND